MKQFPNGFNNWQETHFNIVSYIAITCETVGTMANSINNKQGTGGLYDLALNLTNEFEKLHKGKQWDGEYFDEIENFLELKENEHNNQF